jgi:hypothetical protein
MIALAALIFGAGIVTGATSYRIYLRRLYELERKIKKIQRGGR